MEETSGRATEEGSLSQDGQTCNRCCVYRTEHKFIHKFEDQKIKSYNSAFASNPFSNLKSKLQYIFDKKKRKNISVFTDIQFSPMNHVVSSHHTSHHQSLWDCASSDSSADAQMQISCVCCPGSQIISQTKTTSAA